jgi:hypothetical protein
MQVKIIRIPMYVISTHGNILRHRPFNDQIIVTMTYIYYLLLDVFQRNKIMVNFLTIYFLSSLIATWLELEEQPQPLRQQTPKL